MYKPPFLISNRAGPVLWPTTTQLPTVVKVHVEGKGLSSEEINLANQIARKWLDQNHGKIKQYFLNQRNRSDLGVSKFVSHQTQLTEGISTRYTRNYGMEELIVRVDAAAIIEQVKSSPVIPVVDVTGIRYVAVLWSCTFDTAFTTLIGGTATQLNREQYYFTQNDVRVFWVGKDEENDIDYGRGQWVIDWPDELEIEGYSANVMSGTFPPLTYGPYFTVGIAVTWTNVGGTGPGVDEGDVGDFPGSPPQITKWNTVYANQSTPYNNLVLLPLTTVSFPTVTVGGKACSLQGAATPYVGYMSGSRMGPPDTPDMYPIYKDVWLLYKVP